MARGKGLARQSQQGRLEEEDAPACPLCIEPLDSHEQTWYPCTCGYQVCAFCYQRLQLENNNQCPGCRTEYGTRKEPLQRPESKSKTSPSKPHNRSSPKQAANGLPGLRNSAGSVAGGASKSAPAPSANGRQVSEACTVDQSNRQLADERGGPSSGSGSGNGSQSGSKPGEAAASDAEFRRAASSLIGQSGNAESTVADSRAPAEVPDLPQTAGTTSTEVSVTAPTSQGTGDQATAAEGGGLGKTTNWADPKAASADASALHLAPPPPSPSKWPELGSAGLPASSTGAGASFHAAMQPPAPPPRPAHLGSAATSQQPQAALSAGRRPESNGKAAETTPLWKRLLPPEGSRPRPDPQGCQLREAIAQAVSNGDLTSRDGARELVAYLERAAAKQTPAEKPIAPTGAIQQQQQKSEEREQRQPHIQTELPAVSAAKGQLSSPGYARSQQAEDMQIPAPWVPEPPRNGFAPGPLQAPKHSDSVAVGSSNGLRNPGSFGAQGNSLLQGSPSWLQAGVVSGLGLSMGSGLGDLWGPPKPSTNSIWTPKRLNADAVPDPLKELWAAKPQGSDQYLAAQQKGSSSRFSHHASSDSLVSLGKDSSFSSSLGRPSHLNGYGGGNRSSGMALHAGVPASSSQAFGSSSQAFGNPLSQALGSSSLSQGLAAGLGSSALQASQGYLQGIQTAFGKPTQGHSVLGAAQGYSQGLAAGLGNSAASHQSYANGQLGQSISSQGFGSNGLGEPRLPASQAFGDNSLHHELSGLGGQHHQQQVAYDLWSHQAGGGALQQQGMSGLGQLQTGLPGLVQQSGLRGLSQQQQQQHLSQQQQHLQRLAQQGLIGYGQQSLQQNMQQHQQQNWQNIGSPNLSNLNLGSRLYQQ